MQPGATSTLLDVGFPVRRSTVRRLYTAHRRLSQFYHVLHRLLVPRHPPNALTSLTTETFALITELAFLGSCPPKETKPRLRAAPADGQAIFNRAIRKVMQGLHDISHQRRLSCLFDFLK